ncbi:hypothetical protein BC477_03455 [Clavibacter michiganensis subsp. michiganensis]|uniref:Uncharacterized protein n=1 Tax=Clavibacter michiganensis subsp. michiganensis TaxID=33013 RepID=A0A251XK97_CLAMM|nr:hypothetical protein BC477_03455 [Clavibacter michiganensis subsp. michiganensis]OUE03770.1 hypothetical protein CMMCAS07_02390 [Clavibacter michiganensis subsp. michiganensis]
MRNGAMKSRPWVCSLALTLGWPTAGRGEAGPAAGRPGWVVLLSSRVDSFVVSLGRGCGAAHGRRPRGRSGAAGVARYRGLGLASSASICRMKASRPTPASCRPRNTFCTFSAKYVWKSEPDPVKYATGSYSICAAASA